MLSLFDVPRSVLPRIGARAELYGLTRGMKSLPDGVPVSGMAGDQQAALFGQACFRPRRSEVHLRHRRVLVDERGHVPVQSKSGLLTTVGWRLGDHHHLRARGQLVHRRRGGAVAARRAGAHQEGERRRGAGEDREVDRRGGLRAGARGAGRSPLAARRARPLRGHRPQSTTAGHLARAVLEGIALQIQDLAEAMKLDSGRAIPAFKVDGGAVKNDLLMQFQADVLGTNVVRPKNVETTASAPPSSAGWASASGRAPTTFASAWKADKVFKPKMSTEERAQHLGKWRDAVKRA
jgi:glycerol kinase